MATIKLFYDTRKPKKDGTCPLRLKIFHQNKARYIALKFCFKPSEWNKKDNKVKPSYPNSTRVNLSIQKSLTQASLVLVENENIIEDIDVSELQRLVTLKLFGESKSIKKREYFFTYTESIIKDLIGAKKVGTASCYQTTLNSFKSFLNDNDILLSKIDYRFLKNYETNCLQRGLKVNAISVYLRTLRAIINKAINEGILLYSNYPFRQFNIKSERTEKRAISREDVVKIMNLKLDKQTPIWHCQNYFIFMFNMRGMNFIDLAYLTKDNLRGDRIIYKRKKTAKLYDIKITTKAQEILNYYLFNNSRDYIFPIMPEEIDDIMKERKIYIDKRKQFNKYLKQIAKKCNIEANLTSYVSRHTWASLAKFSGVSHAIIGESLGHSDLKTTETYLANFDTKTLDDANDKIVGL